MRKSPNESSLDFCRWKYQVPAYRGVKVKTYADRVGEIIGGHAGSIKVGFEEKPKVEYHHPTNVKYMLVLGDDAGMYENIHGEYD